MVKLRRLFCMDIGGFMMKSIVIGKYAQTVVVFSLLFSYVLSFCFEGQVFYAIGGSYSYNCGKDALYGVFAHFIGLVLCGFVVKSAAAAKNMILFGSSASVVLALTFFFAPGPLWLPALMFSSLFCGVCVASWAFFIRNNIPKGKRLMACVDLLIFSNLIMIFNNFVSINISPKLGLLSSLLFLSVGIIFSLLLDTEDSSAGRCEERLRQGEGLCGPVLLLCIFVTLLTIDSGLMYRVFNPAFDHLNWLTSWYWALPYIAALFLMRKMPLAANRAGFLYLGMLMIVLSFVLFMFMGRTVGDYIIINTLMLGACGIFDLFWWSVAADMLDYPQNPAKLFGWCLGANVLGVLIGGVIGRQITNLALSEAHTAVAALSVVCVTLAILPLLNAKLLSLLKEHTYIWAYHEMNNEERVQVRLVIEKDVVLTDRERDVFALLLDGLPYKRIAEKLNVSENTVKYHIKNLYSKYDVSSRAELLGRALKK